MWESVLIKSDKLLKWVYSIWCKILCVFCWGIESEKWLNSQSTFHKAGVGGIDGHALKDGQRVL